jgi:gamma-glutamyltranspeptidase/glutathione hydrolase
MKARTAWLALALVACGASKNSAPTETPRPEASSSTTAIAAPSAAASASPASRVPSSWPFPPRATTAPSPHGAVTSDSSYATKIGVAVLQAGGNAVDAAVATAFALAVAYPTAGNLGGGGFAVVHARGEDRALDFRETAPSAVTRAIYAGPDGKPNGASRQGWLSSGVPGSVAGLYALHKAKGSKPWRDVIAPAIALAKDGLVVDASFHDEIDDAMDRLPKDPASAALFLVNGAPPAVGSTWKNPDLARVLERIAEKGPAGFYEGPTAETIASEMKAHGGLVTTDDLKSYEAKWRAPIAFTYRGARVVAMPPPSSGGVVLAMIAHIVEPYDLGKMPWLGAEAIHVEAEAMRRAFAARNARLGDPDFVENPLAELLSPAWADAQRASIAPDRATPSSAIPSAAPAPSGPHTTNLCAVDAMGNAVALTTTINWFFGNGITIAGTGMVMNNEMDDFASVPGTANGFGLVQGEPNVVAAKKRPLSSMSPIVVLDDHGAPMMVAGAAGGPRIITSVFETMSNVLDRRVDAVGAVDAPRFHMQHMPDVIRYEKGGLEPDVKARLEAMGYKLDEAKHLGTTNAIVREAGPGSGWIPAAEPRRSGTLALGY